MRRLLALAALVALVAPASAATVSVTVKNIDFSRATVRIDKGGTVRWLFRDAPSPHNVTSQGRPRFPASPSKQSGSYAVRFTKAGTYRYRCTIHPSMTGRVIVG